MNGRVQTNVAWHINAGWIARQSTLFEDIQFVSRNSIKLALSNRSFYDFLIEGKSNRTIDIQSAQFLEEWRKTIYLRRSHLMTMWLFHGLVHTHSKKLLITFRKCEFTVRTANFEINEKSIVWRQPEINCIVAHRNVF